MLTFTALNRHIHEPALPAPAYRALLSQGLRETHGWTEEQADDYLDGLISA